MQFLDFSTSNSQITDEIINLSDSNPVSLRKDLFYNKTGKLVVISTGSGGGGTVLTETTDYTIGGAFTDGNLPSSIAPDVAYSTVAITNAAYHSTDLYVAYYPIADLIGAGTLNTMPRFVERDLVNDISAADVTITPAVTNDTENGDRFYYAWQDGDGSHEFKLANPTGWTIAGANGTTLDSTALGRVGEGTGFIELDADLDNSVLNIVGYSDSDAGNFTGNFEKTASGKLYMHLTISDTLDLNQSSVGWYRNSSVALYNLPITRISSSDDEIVLTSNSISGPMVRASNCSTTQFGAYYYRGSTSTGSTVGAIMHAFSEWY